MNTAIGLLGAVDASLAEQLFSRWRQQDTWYIDAINGDDSNSGQTEQEALKTFAEYSNRVGDGLVEVYQTVNILTDLDEDTYRIRASYAQGVTFQGARTVQYQGTISAQQAWNLTSTPVTDGQISDSSLSWASHVGRQVVLTSGAHSGKVSWVLKDLGSNTCRLNEFADPWYFARGWPSVGDTFDITTVPVLSGTVLLEQNAIAGQSFVDFEDLHLQGDYPITGRGASLYLGACKIESTVTHNSLLYDTVTTGIATLFASKLGIQGGEFVLYSCSFRDSTMRAYAGSISLGWNNVIQAGVGGVQGNDHGIRVFQSAKVSVLYEGGFGACDIAGSAQSLIDVESGGLLESHGMTWTLAMATGFGMWINSNGTTHWPGGNASSYYNFDTSSGGVEFRVGGVNTTAASLAAVGTITAANNAAAVPLSN